MNANQLEIQIKTDNKMTVELQTSSDKNWADETGTQIPYNRLMKSEKVREKNAYALAKKALSIHEMLKAFKLEMREAVNEVYSILAEENDVKKDNKGNITFFNFNRSIKIETNVAERIAFDEALIAMSKAKLDSFLDQNMSATDGLIKQLVTDAFSTTKGGLDAKKVMSLLRYRSKIKAQDFIDALDLIEKSMSRPSSKTYFRIHVLNTEGGYDNVNLNFSNVD